jgi:hypothetical protein
VRLIPAHLKIARALSLIEGELGADFTDLGTLAYLRLMVSFSTNEEECANMFK